MSGASRSRSTAHGGGGTSSNLAAETVWRATPRQARVDQLVRAENSPAWRVQLPATGTKRRTVVFDKMAARMRWKMSDTPLIQLIRAEMQRFTERQYQIAFDQFDVKSLQELLRFLLDAEYEHPRS